MKKLGQFSDIHSHNRSAALRSDTVVNISPGDEMLPDGYYSVGIHPWESDKTLTLTTLKSLVAMVQDKRVVAVGECGFDRLRGADIERQRAIFDFHARLAQRYDKPLIIHAVRSNDELVAAIRRHSPTVEWIIHGFRGKPELARQLLREGFSLSIGKKFNAELLSVIPAERLYRETDES